jgi:hypothetical protein
MLSRGLILIVLGAIIAGTPSLFANPFDWKAAALTWFGLAVSVVGGIIQERDGKPFVLNFSPDDWLTDTDGFFIDVPRLTHRKGKAGIAELYVLDEQGRYRVCIADVARNTDGDCRVDIGANPFTGRIVIQ